MLVWSSEFPGAGRALGLIARGGSLVWLAIGPAWRLHGDSLRVGRPLPAVGCAVCGLAQHRCLMLGLGRSLPCVADSGATEGEFVFSGCSGEVGEKRVGRLG